MSTQGLEKRLASAKALAPKHKGGEMEEWQAAYQELLVVERELAAARGQEYAVTIEFPAHWDGGAPRLLDDRHVQPILRQVTSGEEPVLNVFHDLDDHGWQFIGSTGAIMDDAMLVALEDVVKLDPSVLKVADIELGWVRSENRD